MMSRSSRLIAALLQSDRRRLAASVLAALSVGATDAITPVDQPLVATVDHGSARIAAPQPTGAEIVISRCSAVEIDPLRSVQDRSPPALAS